MAPTRAAPVVGTKGHPGVAGLSKLLASLDHTGRGRVVLGHTLTALRTVIAKKSHLVLSKFTSLCWATGTALLGCRLAPPAGENGKGRMSCSKEFCSKAAEVGTMGGGTGQGELVSVFRRSGTVTGLGLGSRQARAPPS